METRRRLYLYKKKKTFLVQNTCPFDAVSVLIAMAYTDIVSSYKQFIDKIKKDFLIFCKNLSQEGPTFNIYKSRVLLHQTIFKTDASIKYTNLIDARCNVTLMIKSYLRNAPSSIETITCFNNCPSCSTSKSTSWSSYTIKINEQVWQFGRRFKSIYCTENQKLNGKKQLQDLWENIYLLKLNIFLEEYHMNFNNFLTM